MRWREEVEHEPCPHCGRNACSWHRPGRVCVYRYTDQPGEVTPRPFVATLTQGPQFPTPPAGKVA